MSYFRNQQSQTGSNPYEFSPLSNQIFPNNGNNNNSSLNNNNNANGGYIYGNQSNSPINSTTSLLNNQQQSNANTNGSAFNHLNLSTRSTTATTGSNSNPLQNSNVYPTPRLNNVVSPSLNFTSLYSNRARFNASKGFDAEDDLEFCPEIHEQFQSHSSPSSASSFTHHKFNPYTASTFSPTVSPTSANASTASPTSSKVSIASNTTPKSEYVPRTTTPRARKVLEIVNPVTGLRVGSPAHFK